MYVIGLTGGIASGKSTVSNLLRQLGAHIIDADQIAREVVEPGQPALQEIVSHFGDAVLLSDGHLNRKKLGDIVFASNRERQVLDEITHKRVKIRLKEAIEQVRAQGGSIVVLDVPLLLETGFDEMVNAVWVVYVTEATQEIRLMARNSMTASEAVARIRSQMPLGEKQKYASVVIDNSGSLQETKQQVIAAWRRVLTLSIDG